MPKNPGTTLDAPQPNRTSPSPVSEAHEVVLPAGIVSSGLPAVRGTCAELGLDFDAWQIEVARCILSKNADGLYAADTAVLSIPRQVGKTFLVGALVFADCIINPGTTTVWTAHRFKVARESFNEMKGWAQRPQLAPHIDADSITTAAGNESIPFRNGSRIVFAARERSAVRGFTKVRRIILDEAQILSESAMSDMAPTMNQAVNPQMILMGTPPKPTDPSEVFTHLRDDALNGAAEDVFYVELAAPEDSDLDDLEAWFTANPSLGNKRTPVKAIRRLRKLLSDDDFSREALGIWGRTSSSAVIDFDQWQRLTDPKSEATDPVVFAVDVTPDRSRASIGVASRRTDGVRHVEVVDNDRGTGWVVDRVVQLLEKWPDSDIVLDPSGPAGSLVTDLAEKGITPILTSGREMAQACGKFYDIVLEDELRHLGQPSLNAAIGAARKRNLGDAWAWHRKDVTHDISPLVAVTLAMFGHDLQSTNKPKRSGKAAFY